MNSKMLYVEKKNIFNTKVVNAPISDLENGDVLLKVERFALTSNNVTYAVTGFQIGYWKFFPAPDQWGIVPVWGFASVIESKNEAIAVGERLYGYFPMGEHLKISAGRISDYSLSDVSLHRAELPPIYNNYSRLKDDEITTDYANFGPIVRPLFTTSFLIDQFLQNEDYFSAEQMVITSASSKTSLGLAYVLSNQKTNHNKKIVGLTSPSNVDFVKGTGFYDEVIAYEDVPSEMSKTETVVIDMAGNGQLLMNLYKDLDEKLKHICKVGVTDWKSASNKSKIPVAKFFFAPSAAQVFFKKHGAAIANEMITKAMFDFIGIAKNWVDIEQMDSYEKLEKQYLEMVNGKVNPGIGYIMVN